MKKIFLTLLTACVFAGVNAQTKVELADFQSKAESLSGQQVQISGYLVEIGKDSKTAIIATTASMQKPNANSSNGKGAKPSSSMVRVSTTSAVNSSLKGKSVIVTGTVSEEKMPEMKGGKGGKMDSTKVQRPPKDFKGGNVSDTTSRRMPPQNGNKQKPGKHYMIDNAVISEK